MFSAAADDDIQAVATTLSQFQQFQSQPQFATAVASTALITYTSEDVEDVDAPILVSAAHVPFTDSMDLPSMKRSKIPRVVEWPYVIDKLLPPAKFMIDNPCRIDWVRVALMLTRWIKPCFRLYVNLVTDEKTAQIIDICGSAFTGHGTHAIQFMSSTGPDTTPLVSIVLVHRAARSVPRRAACFKFGLRIYETGTVYSCDSSATSSVEWEVSAQLCSPTIAAIWLLKDILNDAVIEQDGSGMAAADLPCTLVFAQDVPVACRQIDLFSKNMLALMVKKARTSAAAALSQRPQHLLLTGPLSSTTPAAAAPPRSIFQRVAAAAPLLSQTSFLPRQPSAFTSMPVHTSALHMRTPVPVRGGGGVHQATDFFTLQDTAQPPHHDMNTAADANDGTGPVLFAPDDATIVRLATLTLLANGVRRLNWSVVDIHEQALMWLHHSQTKPAASVIAATMAFMDTDEPIGKPGPSIAIEEALMHLCRACLKCNFTKREVEFMLHTWGFVEDAAPVTIEAAPDAADQARVAASDADVIADPMRATDAANTTTVPFTGVVAERAPFDADATDLYSIAPSFGSFMRTAVTTAASQHTFDMRSCAPSFAPSMTQFGSSSMFDATSRRMFALADASTAGRACVSDSMHPREQTGMYAPLRTKRQRELKDPRIEDVATPASTSRGNKTPIAGAQDINSPVFSSESTSARTKTKSAEKRRKSRRKHVDEF